MAEARVDQSELGRRLGITSQAVNQWLKPDGTVPTLRRLEDIADALGASLPRLVDWDRTSARKVDPQNIADLPHKASELDLLAIWRALSDEGQFALMITARALAISAPRNPKPSRAKKRSQ